jgi:hypothetical protein
MKLKLGFALIVTQFLIGCIAEGLGLTLISYGWFHLYGWFGFTKEITNETLAYMVAGVFLYLMPQSWK